MENEKITKKDNAKVVNKLFLIGNGFDLALNLKTKYEDFLFWYFNKFINRSYENKIKTISPNGEVVYFYNEDDLFIFYSKTNYKLGQKYIDNFNKEHDTYDKIKKFLNSNINFTYNFKSELAEKIFKDSIKGWVDIEGIFFDLLRKELKSKTKSGIDKLNSNLLYISDLLKVYLAQINVSISNDDKLSFKYINQFIRSIDEKDFIISFQQKQLKSNIYYFLNFNYTSTLTNILKHLKSEYYSEYGYDINIINSQIHRSLNSEELIFGFGDEIDKDYKEIEELNDNRFFDNIKSFKYAKYHDYRNLLRFLNSENYQVVIYGHSCGLSDRLLLNEVFEHENCKSIKIYYYNKEEFIQKTMDISRHFNSNQLMRQKIVEFSEQNQIPQEKPSPITKSNSIK